MLSRVSSLTIVPEVRQTTTYVLVRFGSKPLKLMSHILIFIKFLVIAPLLYDAGIFEMYAKELFH